jgi:hypothetical protein
MWADDDFDESMQNLLGTSGTRPQLSVRARVSERFKRIGRGAGTQQLGGDVALQQAQTDSDNNMISSPISVVVKIRSCEEQVG